MELKIRRVPPQMRIVQKKRSRQKISSTREGVERGAQRARTVKKTREQAWPWTTLKKPCQKINVLKKTQAETAVRCKTKKNEECQTQSGLQKRIPRQGFIWMQRTSASADETSTCRRYIGLAYDFLTFLADAALENAQIDKAMATMGIAQNLKKERHRSKRRRMKVGARRVGASDMPGAPCGELKDEGKVPGQPFDLEYVLRQREGNANRRGLECVVRV